MAPKRLRDEILPYDRVNMEKLLGELETQGLIVHYTINGKDYGWIPTFSQHQKPHPNEKASEIPPCPLENIPDNKTSNIKEEPEYDHEKTENIKDVNYNNTNEIPRSTNEILRCEASNTKDVINPSALTASLVNGNIKDNLNTTPLPPTSGGDGSVPETDANIPPVLPVPDSSPPPVQKTEKPSKQKLPNHNSVAELRKAMNVYANGNEQLAKTLEDYRQMREAKKKPMTYRALELILAKLDNLSAHDDELKIRLLEQSIVGTWTDIYPLRENIRYISQTAHTSIQRKPAAPTVFQQNMQAQDQIASFLLHERIAKREMKNADGFTERDSCSAIIDGIVCLPDKSYAEPDCVAG